MFLENNNIRCYTKWRILNEELINKKKKLTYFSPGGYSFEDKNGNTIFFDWNESYSVFDKSDDSIIANIQYTIDKELISEGLLESNLKHLISKNYGLEFFKDFKKMKEIYCAIDIDNEEVTHEGNVECIYFELNDLNNESLVLIGEKDE